MIAGLFEGKDKPIDSKDAAVLDRLLAGNYTSQDSAVESSNTISHEIMDFLAATGEFHKKFDKQTIQGNPAAQFLYDNVFGRWSTLGDEAKKFYNMFIQIHDSTPTAIPESQYQSIRFNLANHKFVLRMDGGANRFVAFLPKYDVSQVKDSAYTSAVNTIKLTNHKGLDHLEHAYKQGSSWAEAIAAAKATKFFSINFAKFTRHRLAEVSKGLFEEDVAVDEDAHLISYTGKMNHIKWDASKKAYFMEKEDPLSGKKDRVELGTDANVDNLMQNAHECYTTFVNDKGNKKNCDTWLNQCILGRDKKDLGECLNALKNQDFFRVAKTNIETMHPLMALQILRQFGFRKHLVYDSTSGSDLWKVECVNHWQKHQLRDHHSAKEINDMINNPDSNQLLQYLDLVSQFVNCSPAILNKNHTGQSDEATGVFNVPDEAKKLNLTTPTPAPASYVLSPMLGYLLNSKYIPSGAPIVAGPTVMFGGNKKDMYGGDFGQAILSPFGTPTFTPGLSMFRARRGPGVDNTCSIITAHLKNQGHDIMNEIFKGLHAGLKAKGKVLDQESKDKLSKKLQNYQEIQNELLKTLCYTEEYAKAVDKMGDYSQKTVSDNVMQKFGERYQRLFGKYNSMEKTILSDFLKIALNESDKEDTYNKFG